MKELKMKNKPKCESFTEADFQAEVLESNQPVLVVFEANWSGTCDIMMPILEDLCDEFKGRVTIGMIDIDSNKKLVESYGIFNLPTLLFFQDGEIVDHILGSAPRQVIAAKLIDMAPLTNK